MCEKELSFSGGKGSKKTNTALVNNEYCKNAGIQHLISVE
jgi:hypothetical protein